MSQATEKQQLYIYRLLAETGGDEVEISLRERKWWGVKTATKSVFPEDVPLLTKLEASAVIDVLLSVRDG